MIVMIHLSSSTSVEYAASASAFSISTNPVSYPVVIFLLDPGPGSDIQWSCALCNRSAERRCHVVKLLPCCIAEVATRWLHWRATA